MSVPARGRRITQPLALALALAAIGATGGPIGGVFHAVGIGGYRGNDYVAHESGDAYEYSEDVTVDFNEPADLAGLAGSVTISPETPHSFYHWNEDRRISITMRKDPGITYRITVARSLRSKDGQSLAQSYAFSITTPATPSIPAPLRATPNEPYRYGVLAHPFPFSLTGSSSDRHIALMADAGVRFVRIDYCGDQIDVGSSAIARIDPRSLINVIGVIKAATTVAQTGSGYDWHVIDGVTDRLIAHRITELPIVEQYCAPKRYTGGKGYPYIWQQPSDYAAFARAIAAHIARKYPQITRIELFNEPNLNGWWRNANPEYASRAGDAAATYMKAAYAAIKQAAPQLTVVGPALADGGTDVDPRKFLVAMYDGGCGRGKCWDVLSIHNYRWYNPTFHTKDSYQNQWGVYKQLQRIAADHGDPGTHVMLTEWGFSTNEQPEGFDPKVQAEYVALGFNLMLVDPTVDGIVYVNMYNPGNDFWAKTALTNADFSKKPAFDVFKTFSTYAGGSRASTAGRDQDGDEQVSSGSTRSGR